MALMTYLLKDRNGTYYFRRVIPPELRPFMPAPWEGKANWKRTLGTKNPKDAKVAASKALRECTNAFRSAERVKQGHPIGGSSQTPSSSFDIDEIESGVIAEMLADDDAEREFGDDRKYLQTPEERAQWPDLVKVAFGQRGMEEDHHLVYGDHISEEAEQYRKALARKDPRIIDAELRIYLKSRGVPIEPNSDFYREAGLKFLRGKVRGSELLLKKQGGEIVEAPIQNAAKGPKLSEAFASWKTGGSAKGARKPGANTVREAEYAVRRFQEWHSDLLLAKIDKGKARDFRDALSRLPTRLPKDLQKLSLRDLLKRDLSKFPLVYATTVNKSLQLLSGIVAHAIREGRMDDVANFVNPFQGIKLAIDAREVEGREIFNAADLNAIFSTPIYKNGERPRGGGGEAAFWLPLIALCTGARQGELAQLRIADLKQDKETGLWFFDISTEGGRSIKTASARRKVPVHKALLDIGLLDYRASCQDDDAAGDSSLWPDIKSDAQGRRAGPWSKWFNRYLRDVAKVEDRGKVFHSFRHTFKRLARDAGISEELHDALTGHSGGGVGRSYGSGFGLKALAEALNSIDAPAAIGCLRWAQKALMKELLHRPT